jgi:DNA ligase-1
MADRVMLADNKPIRDELIQKHLDETGFLFGQPKIDGMRVYHGRDHIPQSRSGKEWKNKPLRAWCQAHPSMVGIDGEVVPGHIYTPDSFRDAMSGTRREEGSREFTFFVFDHTVYNIYPYWDRYRFANDCTYGAHGQYQSADQYHAKIVLCPTERLETLLAVKAFEERMIVEGWDGAMLRRPDRPYKFGRSTNLGGELIKLKRYEDAEAIVIGYTPWDRNDNEATESPLGYTVRSNHQDGKTALERLGAWRVQLLTDRSVEFSVGVLRGVSHSDRDRLWADRDAYIGRIFKFKHQGYGGGYDKPRQPVFLNWRSQTEF